MTAPDSVLGFLAERGPAPTSEIAQALSEKYGHSTVRAAIIDLKKKGVVVDTGERHQTGGRPEHIVALERELERAGSRDAALARYAAMSNAELEDVIFGPRPDRATVIRRMKRWFGVK